MATIGDVVLIFYRDESAFFARIDSIQPDIKKGWFKVHLLILAIPMRTVTWILREEYLNGIPFTMEGNPVRIESIKPLPIETYSDDIKEKVTEKVPPKEGRKVIPFEKFKKDSTKETA